MNMRITTAALAFLAVSGSAMAEVKLNENFAVSGYAAASYKYNDVKPGGSDHSTDIDSALLGSTFNFEPVTGSVSVLYRNGVSPNEVALLDAYLTYKMVDGYSVTVGKFLSYMGYESFYPTNMDQISWANGDFLAPIPGFHTGARIDYAGETSSAGLAIVDSVYSPHGAIKGDGEIKHNAGFEYFYSYTGVKNLTLWAGAAYDTAGGFQGKTSTTLLDFWASYKVSDTVRVAAEYAHKNGGLGDTGYNWLTFLNYSINEKVSCSFRISGEKLNDGGPSFTKYTFSPGYAITKNISVRAEYSSIDYKNAGADSANFFGVQTIFKF